MTLPGHSIPYAFTSAEIAQFLEDHTDDGQIVSYLQSHYPAWGITVQEPYGTLLVWSDASGVLHVIDITNMGLAEQINQAPYQSPDSGYIAALMAQIQDTVKAAVPIGQAALIAAALWAAVLLLERLGK